MRSSYFGAVFLAAALPVACGGGAARPPNAEGQATENAPAPSADHAEAADAGAAAPEAKEETTASAKPAAAATSSGDLVAPPADDPWMAPHQMPPKDVLRTMRAAMGKVDACYHAAKKRDPSASGEVKIKFVITHEGAVRVWRDEDSSMSDPDCTKCVGDVMQGLKFPTQKSPGDAWGIYQVTFGG